MNSLITTRAYKSNYFYFTFTCTDWSYNNIYIYIQKQYILLHMHSYDSRFPFTLEVSAETSSIN